MSKGNGHPFSWAAIINGYNAAAMASCPFSAIPEYLGERAYPEDFIQGARVTHVWTQNPVLSRHVAEASLIETVVERPEDMMGAVDAVLLARDDAENHRRFAEPFLRAGIPIYVDKPLALSRGEAEALFAMAASERHLFSCTALRYAAELVPGAEQLARIGRVRMVDAWVPKYWDTYAVHAIEPVLQIFPDLSKVRSHNLAIVGGTHQLNVVAENGMVGRFTSTGDAMSPIGYRILGDSGYLDLVFRDSFSAFKAALIRFLAVVRGQATNIDRRETLDVVEFIQLGRRS
ncbi:hypothetical protein FHR20_000571 [Sphingomonas leidyi]|uniref:Gfo/Idh/MocA-like oxidoreductase N-terminal domain-containing protein n=1 Tax=Sphingomonas leidyi TaxID=68569 RepID=A0A7X5UXB4_9SPHN|nr:Gfo/Idh/MocA family oxidoreductase [Sphingomonas leidyi]NIJ63640.1 hypothetical protein [Sphingomonas leidyi]